MIFNLDIDKVKLTGKGIKLKAGEEWTHENMKLVSIAAELHEVVIENEEKEERIGWIVIDDLVLYADLTVHSSGGMLGQSIKENIKYSAIIDFNNSLDEFIGPQLKDVDISESQKILDEFKSRSHSNMFRNSKYLSDKDHDDKILAIVSYQSGMLFVQTSDSTIVLSKDNGVLIVERENDSLVEISTKAGVRIIKDGEEKIQIGKGPQMIINGHIFDPSMIVRNITKSFSKGFAHFGRHFGSDFRDDFDLDLDFDF